jgi:hypothetical protein
VVDIRLMTGLFLLHTRSTIDLSLRYSRRPSH